MTKHSVWTVSTSRCCLSLDGRLGLYFMAKEAVVKFATCSDCTLSTGRNDCMMHLQKTEKHFQMLWSYYINFNLNKINSSPTIDTRNSVAKTTQNAFGECKKTKLFVISGPDSGADLRVETPPEVTPKWSLPYPR